MQDVFAFGFSNISAEWENAMGIDDKMPGLELDLSGSSTESSRSDRGFSPVLTPPVSCHTTWSTILISFYVSLLSFFLDCGCSHAYTRSFVVIVPFLFNFKLIFELSFVSDADAV